MKNFKFGFLGAMAFATAMFFSSCSDPCKDVTCVNGTCVDGDCECDAGYEGVDCSSALNAKFDGNYSNNETCNPSGTAAYAVTVAPKSGSQTQVNFTGLWEEPQAIVTGDVGTDGVAFTIERQALGTSGFDISGSGTANAEGTSINVSYSVFATGGTTAVDACSAVLTK